MTVEPTEPTAEPLAVENCGLCMYWAAIPPQKTNGLCRRYPPQVPGDALRWPTTFKNHWCGDFEAGVAPPQQLEGPTTLAHPHGPE